MLKAHFRVVIPLLLFCYSWSKKRSGCQGHCFLSLSSLFFGSGSSFILTALLDTKKINLVPCFQYIKILLVSTTYQATPDSQSPVKVPLDEYMWLMYFMNLITSGPCKQKPNSELDNFTGSYKIPFSASLLTKRSQMHKSLPVTEK